MAAVTICSDFGGPKIKSDTVSTVSPSISHEVMGLDAIRREEILAKSHILKVTKITLRSEAQRKLSRNLLS